MSDIETYEDLEHLVESFYAKAKPDEVIGYLFTEVVQLDWEHHIPTITKFWEAILLEGNQYQGNPMTKHVQLHKKSPLKKVHFDRWLLLWKETVDELFSGEVAEEAKSRAQHIAGVMLFKVSSS